LLRLRQPAPENRINGPYQNGLFVPCLFSLMQIIIAGPQQQTEEIRDCLSLLWRMEQSPRATRCRLVRTFPETATIDSGHSTPPSNN